MRSPTEIIFRLRQEAANILLAIGKPGTTVQVPSPLPALPDPQQVAAWLRSTSYAGEVAALAEQILQRRIPLLGLTLETGPDTRWRRDYSKGIETPPHYFRRIPYLDPDRAGDHKIIWELNRHPHLVLLAQANLLQRDQRYLDTIQSELESWWAANPYQCGINWTSALEVGFRTLSWIWIYHLAGAAFPAEFRARFLSSLVQHGLHLEYNLSVYFSPNTHLLGEALALYALGRLLPQLPAAARWQSVGSRVVREEMDRQVLEDGAHFEQSAYYHVYATDMFLFYALLAKPDQAYLDKLRRMAEFLDTLGGPSRILPLFGDDDGGRLFHPYGERTGFLRGTLAACATFLNRPEWLAAREDLYPFAAWWMGADSRDQAPATHPPFASRHFANSGIAALFDGDLQVLFDGGPFGFGSGGHSHSDTLSVVIRKGTRQILTDPGTYTYVGDRFWRNCFRGSAFHNTVRVDGLDQATPATPFSWRNPPQAAMLSFQPRSAEAQCAYQGFRHLRTVTINQDATVIVTDEITGPPGLHTLEWFWHFASPQNEAREVISVDPRLSCSWEEGGEFGWLSPAMGVRYPAAVLHATWQTHLPVRCETRFRTENPVCPL